MIVIEPSFRILTKVSEEYVLKFLEFVGRKAYKSESKICKDSALKFISAVIEKGHESVIEHFSISVLVICDRGVSHEIVRHRLASYTQESTRYCNYSKGQFGEELTFIRPCFWEDKSPQMITWRKAMENASHYYLSLIKLGAAPQEARSVLPNSLKTEIVMTMNLREWRHFFKLRTAKTAQSQMVEIATKIHQEMKQLLPSVFN